MMNKKTGQGASVTQTGKGFAVAASPLNAVKLDLAILLVVGIVLLLIVDKLIDHFAGQLVLLFAYGLLAATWIIIRAKRVLARVSHRDDKSSLDL